jgi:hypothetical protein
LGITPTWPGVETMEQDLASAPVMLAMSPESKTAYFCRDIGTDAKRMIR